MISFLWKTHKKGCWCGIYFQAFIPRSFIPKTNPRYLTKLLVLLDLYCNRSLFGLGIHYSTSVTAMLCFYNFHDNYIKKSSTVTLFVNFKGKFESFSCSELHKNLHNYLFCFFYMYIYVISILFFIFSFFWGGCNSEVSFTPCVNVTKGASEFIGHYTIIPFP